LKAFLKLYKKNSGRKLPGSGPGGLFQPVAWEDERRKEEREDQKLANEPS
jgi:hypothetical protein